MLSIVFRILYFISSGSCCEVRGDKTSQWIQNFNKRMWFVFISAAYANFHLIFISNDQDLDFSWLFLLFSGIHCHILFRNKFMYKSLCSFFSFFYSNVQTTKQHQLPTQQLWQWIGQNICKTHETSAIQLSIF